MTKSMLIGIAAALLAALAWSMNFVVPYVIGDYSVFDFAVFRFVISGAIGFGFLAFKWDLVRLLTLRDWLTAFWLGFIGYVGYFLTVVGAAILLVPSWRRHVWGWFPSFWPSPAICVSQFCNGVDWFCSSP